MSKTETTSKKQWHSFSTKFMYEFNSPNAVSMMDSEKDVTTSQGLNMASKASFKSAKIKDGKGM